MLQKGIIETIENKYTAKVRIPKYDKIVSDATSTKTEDLATGIICTLPGMNITYSEGDVVLVDFENDELSKPVILGLLYREEESDSILEINNIDSSINDINDKLDKITGQSLYTHIKYSNDNGMTFTSLYEPSATIETNEDRNYPNEFIVKSNELGINIDPSVKYIYWNIIDENNVDVTESIEIQTHLLGTNYFRGITIEKDFLQKLIELPLEYKPCTEIKLTFKIRKSKEELENYYICLTTDKNSIGSVYGDYIGIQTSNEVTPSGNTKDYSWSSVTARNDININQLSNDLLKRIKANEKDIRGYSIDDLDVNNQPIQSGIALLDAINITLTTILIGLNRDTIILGDKENYVNVNSSELGINTIIQKEYQWTRSYIDNVPHLILYYID